MCSNLPFLTVFSRSTTFPPVFAFLIFARFDFVGFYSFLLISVLVMCWFFLKPDHYLVCECFLTVNFLITFGWSGRVCWSSWDGTVENVDAFVESGMVKRQFLSSSFEISFFFLYQFSVFLIIWWGMMYDLYQDFW